MQSQTISHSPKGMDYSRFSKATRHSQQPKLLYARSNMNGIMGEESTSDRLRAISLIDPKTIKKPVIPAQDNTVLPLKGLFKGVKGQQTVSPTRDTAIVVIPQ